MRARTILTFLCAPVVAACGSVGGNGSSPLGTSEQALESNGEGAKGENADRGDDADRDHDRGPDHIFFIMMENHSTDEIIGNTADAPFINELASRYAVATNYFGVTHPSLPNYLAAISGDFQGIWDDCKAGSAITCAPEEFVPGSGDGTDGNFLTPAEIASASATPHWFAGKNLIDQLEASHRSWKAYMESIPAAGDPSEYAPILTDDAGVPTTVKLYAQKHNPFMYFSDIGNSQERLAKIVPFTGFEEDMEAKRIPSFVWISPNQCNDMHGISPSTAALVGIPSCGFPDSGLDHGAIALGDAFLKHTVSKIMHSRAWEEDSAIVIAWDEDDYAGFAGCCGSPTGVSGTVLGGAKAPALVITSRGARRQVADHPYNHYSLLGTIQKLWGLGCLANTCSFGGSDLMTRLFRP
jgi:hypothetical protein